MFAMLPDDTGVGQREAGDNCLCRPMTAFLHPVKVLYIGSKKAGMRRVELAIGTQPYRGNKRIKSWR